MKFTINLSNNTKMLSEALYTCAFLNLSYFELKFRSECVIVTENSAQPAFDSQVGSREN